jgi:hypothetical protein
MCVIHTLASLQHQSVPPLPLHQLVARRHRPLALLLNRPRLQLQRIPRRLRQAHRWGLKLLIPAALVKLSPASRPPGASLQVHGRLARPVTRIPQFKLNH